MQRVIILPALALVVGLSACQQGSDFERAAIGGVVGCAVGEIIKDGNLHHVSAAFPCGVIIIE